jgi:type IX secretion system PorP/SprF family membrane protein
MDNSHSLDFSSGFLIYDDQWYAGGAIHHLFQPDIRIYGFSPLHMKYTIHAGYSREQSIRNNVRSKVSVSPNVVFQYQSGFWRLNGGASISLEPLVLGVWYRHSFKHPNSLIFQLGVKRVNYAIGYSYDYSLSGFSGAVTGAHEISVLLNLQCDDPNDKYRILNCPAF